MPKYKQKYYQLSKRRRDALAKLSYVLMAIWTILAILGIVKLAEWIF